MTGKSLATIALIGASGLALSGCVDYGVYGAGYYGSYDPYYDTYDYRGGYYAAGPLVYAEPGYYGRYRDYRSDYRYHRGHGRGRGHYHHHR